MTDTEPTITAESQTVKDRLDLETSFNHFYDELFKQENGESKLNEQDRIFISACLADYEKPLEVINKWLSPEGNYEDHKNAVNNALGNEGLSNEDNRKWKLMFDIIESRYNEELAKNEISHADKQRLRSQVGYLGVLKTHLEVLRPNFFSSKWEQDKKTD